MRTDHPPPDHDERRIAGDDALNRDEVAVVDLVIRGLAMPAIAQRLHVSEHTIRARIHSTMNKLGSDARAQLAALVLASEADASSGGRRVRSRPTRIDEIGVTPLRPRLCSPGTGTRTRSSP
jgi:DNA-binding CsgD family transcriptional regulator